MMPIFMTSDLLMSPHLFALLERIHGHLGVLGLAVLAHPVLTLGRVGELRPGTRLSAWLAAGLISAPSALGWLLYPTYREQLKPTLIATALPWALAFETKEHLAALTLALTWGGALVLWRGGHTARGRRTARALLLAGWCCGVSVATLGVCSAAKVPPGW
jgi:hypothetical protein